MWNQSHFLYAIWKNLIIYVFYVSTLISKQFIQIANGKKVKIYIKLEGSLFLVDIENN